METKQSRIRKMPASVWAFFVFAYALSWVFWIPAALIKSEGFRPLAIMLYFVGGFGPTVAGVVMIDRTLNKEGQRDFLRRLVDFRRIGGWWYVFILLVFPFFAVLTVLMYRLVQGSLPSLPALAGITDQPQQLIGLPLIALQVLLAGPLSEEIGWRGFALDELQQRWNALVSSLILGALWSLWHVPLFFIQGSMYHDWGFGTGLFWLFLVRMIALSVIMTWVYNKNRNSILSAILLHFGFNFTFGFLHPAPAQVHLYGTLLFVAFTVAVAWIQARRMI